MLLGKYLYCQKLSKNQYNIIDIKQSAYISLKELK
jgi:hypothetical protein